MSEEILLMIGLVLIETIDIILMIHVTIMTEMILDILPMILEIIKVEMIQDILLMTLEIISIEMTLDILPMIHEMILEVMIFEEVQVVLMIIGKIVDNKIVFKTIGKIIVVEVLEVLKTLMTSFNKIIDETHLINFRQEKDFLRKNFNNY